MQAFVFDAPCTRLNGPLSKGRHGKRTVCPVRACTAATLSKDTPKSPRLSIDYCTGCRWGLRAGWMAQELLVTFETDLAEVSLRPSQEGGTFDVWLDGSLLWCRKEEGRFPELKVIKRKVRDIIRPEKSLGHSDHRSTV